MKIGIFHEKLTAFGGAEKITFFLADFLSDKGIVDIYTIASSEISIKDTIKEKFNINSKFNIKYLKRTKSANKILRYFYLDDLRTNISRKYDIFINVSTGDFFYSKAGKNILYIHFPIVQTGVFSKAKTLKEKISIYLLKKILKSYDKTISISNYSKKWIEKKIGLNAVVINPFGSNKSVINNADIFIQDKKKCILSVARFTVEKSLDRTLFEVKKQSFLIDVFKEMFDKGMIKDYELYLAGNYVYTENNEKFFSQLKEQIKGYPIFLYKNFPEKELEDLYKKSSIFWHSVGVCEDEKKFPERMEHFGIVICDALFYGCIPVLYGYGGSKEIIQENISGFVFYKKEEFINKTMKIINKEFDVCEMRKNCVKRAGLFSFNIWKEKIEKCLNLK